MLHVFKLSVGRDQYIWILILFFEIPIRSLLLFILTFTCWNSLCLLILSSPGFSRLLLRRLKFFSVFQGDIGIEIGIIDDIVVQSQRSNYWNLWIYCLSKMIALRFVVNFDFGWFSFQLSFQIFGSTLQKLLFRLSFQNFSRNRHAVFVFTKVPASNHFHLDVGLFLQLQLSYQIHLFFVVDICLLFAISWWRQLSLRFFGDWETTIVRPELVEIVPWGSWRIQDPSESEVAVVLLGIKWFEIYLAWLLLKHCIRLLNLIWSNYFFVIKTFKLANWLRFSSFLTDILESRLVNGHLFVRLWGFGHFVFHLLHYISRNIL